MKIPFLVYWIAGVAGRSTHEVTKRNRIIPTRTVDTESANNENAEASSPLRSLQDQVDSVTMSHLRQVKPPADGTNGVSSFAQTYLLDSKGTKAAKGAKARGYGSQQQSPKDDDYYFGTDDNYGDDGYGGMDDQYIGDDYFSMHDDPQQGNDYHYLSKASKSSKKSKGSKGYVKGSKKQPSEKKSKRQKYSKSKSDKKLHAPGDENFDDDWTNDDLYSDPNYGADYWNNTDTWVTDAPTAAAQSSSSAPTIQQESTPTETNSTGRAHPRVGFAGRRKTSPPTPSPPFSSDLLSSRMGSSGQGNATFTTETTAPVEQPKISLPRIERELFPNPVLLKAHSSSSLQEHQQAVFTETTNIVTTCLKRSYSGYLQAYKLTVEYSDGPDVSYAGVVITDISIKIVISIKTETMSDLKLLTHDSASKVVHECFDGPPLYQLLGGLRRDGVQVNEIVFQDKPFRSPIFDTTDPSRVISNGDTSSGESDSRNSRAALIATFTIGLFVAGSVFYAHRKGKLSKLPIKLDKLGSLSTSIRKRLNGQRLRSLSESMRVKLSQSFSSSDQGSRGSSDQMEASNQTGTRVRTWSGSFRRYPTGGVRPAALQKKPAFSKDFVKSPKSDDQSFAVSVGGDYDVPHEYDFQATPMSQMYGGRLKMQSTNGSEPDSPGEEFSMPEDYNTVAEDTSIYSRNLSVMGGGYRQQRQLSGRAMTTPGREPTRKSNPFLSPTASTPSSADDMMSPKDQPYLDEWSMNSFTTSSPNNATEGTNPSPPYRHWNEKPRGSPGSKLAMPKLS